MAETARRPSLIGGEALSKWMKENIVTDKEVSRILGISEKSVQHYRYGRRPGFDTAFRIEKLTRGEVPVSVWSRWS